MTRERRQYDFEVKLQIVLRHIKDESGRSLCEGFDSPHPAGSRIRPTSIGEMVKTDCIRTLAAGHPPVGTVRLGRTSLRH